MSPPGPRLLGVYVQTKQIDTARALLEKLEKNSQFTAEERPFFLAQVYQLIGDIEQAKSHYLKAIDAAPNRSVVQLEAAKFFMDKDAKLAEKCLRRILESKQSRSGNREHVDVAEVKSEADARRLLATLVVFEGGSEQQIAEAWKLLEHKGEKGSTGSADQRVEAMLLLRRGGSENRDRARKMLESLVSNPLAVTPLDRMILARLYEAIGKPEDAREQLQTLVNREKPEPVHLATYVDHLLRTGRA